jgi:hypothetical protein
MEPMSPWLQYFNRPFPSLKGFSAYRFPGMLVHLPIIGVFLLFGLLLLGNVPHLLPLLPLYLVLGIYLGRDLAILCHYAPLLTLVCMAATLIGLNYLKPIVAATDAIKTRTGISPACFAVGFTLVLVVMFATYVRWFVNRP